MNSERPPQRGNVPELDQCIEKLRFVQATELVRSGKYLEAEAMLCVASASVRNFPGTLR